MMRMKVLVLLALGTTLSACNVNGNITDMTKRSTAMSVGTVTGIVPGATVQKTSGGYQVMATIGEPISSTSSQVQTTSGGYTVYNGVSGNFSSANSYTSYQ